MKMFNLLAAAALLLLIAGLVSGPVRAQESAAGRAHDGEHVIFVIDTSGSMRRYAWDRVQQLIDSTLDEYESIAGIQVLNDEGRPLYLSGRPSQ